MKLYVPLEKKIEKLEDEEKKIIEKVKGRVAPIVGCESKRINEIRGEVRGYRVLIADLGGIMEGLGVDGLYDQVEMVRYIIGGE